MSRKALHYIMKGTKLDRRRSNRDRHNERNPMNESPETTGCDGMAVRPMIPMKGRVVAIYPTHIGPDYKYGDYVAIVCQSPTGDQSDSQTLHLEVTNWEQGRIISETWRSVWNIPQYGTDAEPTDATGRPNQSNPRYVDCYEYKSVI